MALGSAGEDRRAISPTGSLWFYFKLACGLPFLMA
jgi:hypothetical protein